MLSPVHLRERCWAEQRQQQVEGGIKAALRLLQGAGQICPIGLPASDRWPQTPAASE